MMNTMTWAAGEAARRARDGGEYLLLHASRASGRARGHARAHPGHTLFAAAAAGALAYALVRLLARPDGR